jgi:hypothetical protein
MFYSYTGGEHKNMLVRFSICQINALSSCCYLSKVYVAEKKHLAMQKLFTLEKREKVLEKMDKCPRYIKQRVLQCPPEKIMNKIAHVLLQNCFQV